MRSKCGAYKLRICDSNWEYISLQQLLVKVSQSSQVFASLWEHCVVLKWAACKMAMPKIETEVVKDAVSQMDIAVSKKQRRRRRRWRAFAICKETWFWRNGAEWIRHEQWTIDRNWVYKQQWAIPPSLVCKILRLIVCEHPSDMARERRSNQPVTPPTPCSDNTSSWSSSCDWFTPMRVARILYVCLEKIIILFCCALHWHTK